MTTKSQSTTLIATLLVALGVLLRVFLLNKIALRQWLENRVEISTPLTSWSRVLEGIYLKKTLDTASSAYSGDLVHEMPIMLHFYQLLVDTFRQENAKYIFVLVDALNALLLYKIATLVIDYLHAIEALNTSLGKYKQLLAEDETLQSFLISPHTFNKHFWSLFTLAVYLFNPFGWASCVAMSSVVIHNCLLLAWLYFLLKGRVLLAFSFLAVHSNITVYSLVLVFASISFLRQKFNYLDKQGKDKVKFSLPEVLAYLTLFLALVGLVFGLNLWLEDFRTRFIECTYLFIMRTPELMPNLGLFWYFLTEMFDHFLLFFTIVFQFNVFIYAVPLTIRLRDDPVVNIFLQIGFLAVLKSYPSVGDTGFYISMLPMFAYLFPLMRNVLVYSCMLLASSVLAPIMFYLWLGSGGGNANFYFAITLVNSVGQIFLLVDVLYANVKREFIKQNGAHIPKTKSGALALFALE